MIKLVKVNKYFNRRKRNQMHIINNTSLELGDNGLVAILGSSGSGKTTLLNAIGGLDKVNSGKIYINGKKITHKRAYTVDKIRNLNMGYIFQDYKLLENMSVYDNVALSLKMMGIKNKKEIQKRVNYVLEAVKMYRYRNRPAKMLSGGEKQRVAIARALVKNPSIVIADEPTGNLDSKNSLQVMNIIKAISKEKLVILVTHEVDLANFYASRIIELQDGKIVKDYENEPKESLEYRLDNKLYLKDFENINNIDKDDINVNIYSDNKQDKINIKLAIKDGNIYIQSENKVEVVDENSSIELVDDHYKKIDKSIYDEEKYNLENISDKKYKAKYKFQRKRGEKRMKNQKGITLIALVITIIVLLILAGVTIAMLTGENGILNKATTAVNNTTDAELKEAVRLAVATNITNNDGSFVVTDKTALKKEIETANANVTAEVTNIEEGENKGNYSVSVKPKNDSNRTPYTCIIDAKTGKITEPQ